MRVVDPVLVLWRAPTDNDRYARPSPAAKWEAWGLRDPVAAGVAFETTTSEADGGGLRYEHTVTVPGEWDDVARVGVRLTLRRPAGSDDDDDTVEWVGYGPHESYADRCASVRFGRWRSTVAGWHVPYVHPQACGNRHGVKWLRVAGYELEADRLLDVTVSHFTDEDLHAARHQHELRARDETYVWLDAAHRGVGTGAVGPDTPPRYRVPTGEHRWSYVIR